MSTKPLNMYWTPCLICLRIARDHYREAMYAQCSLGAPLPTLISLPTFCNCRSCERTTANEIQPFQEIQKHNPLLVITRNQGFFVYLSFVFVTAKHLAAKYLLQCNWSHLQEFHTTVSQQVSCIVLFLPPNEQ